MPGLCTSKLQNDDTSMSFITKEQCVVKQLEVTGGAEPVSYFAHLYTGHWMGANAPP